MVSAVKDISVTAASDKYVNSYVVTGSGAGAAGVAGSVSVIVIGAAFDSYAAQGVGNSGEGTEGDGSDSQTTIDGQASSSPVGDLLGSSDASANAKALIDARTSGIGISGYFNETSSVDLNSTQAFIGFGANVNAGEDLTVKASDKTLSITAIVAGTGGGAAGVAGAITVAIVHDSAEAFIAAGAVTNAKGDTRVEASTDDKIFNVGITGSGAGAAAVNGVVAVSIVSSDTNAYIGNGALINQDAAYDTSAQSVHVLASSDSYVVAVGGSGGGAGAAAVGGVINVVTFSKSTNAFIGNSAYVSAWKDIVVSAESSELLVGVSVSIFGAGAAAVSGDIGTIVFSNTTAAYIDANAVVDSDGNVKISACDDTLVVAVVAVGNGAGAAAVGGTINVNVLSNTTLSYISDNATVNARGNAAGIEVYTGGLGSASTLPSGGWDENSGLDINGDGIPDVSNVSSGFDVNQDGTPDGSFSGGVDFTVSSENDEDGTDATKNISVANEGLETRLTETIKGLSAVAVSNQKIVTVTIAIAGAGAAGVTGAVATNVLTNTTEAYIGSGAHINENNDAAGAEQTVSVGAYNNTNVLMIEGSIGGAGAAGVSGSFNVAVIENATHAYAGGVIKAKAGISVIASSKQDVTVITANVSGAGGAGVGGAAGVIVIDGETLAYILVGSDISAGTDITVYAKNEADIDVDTLSGAGGGAAGISGGVTVEVISHTTQAYVQDALGTATGTKLYAVGVILIKAESSEDVSGIAVSGGVSGAAGIAGAIIVKVVATTTQAWIGSYAKVNQYNSGTVSENQSVTVWALDTVNIEGIAGSGSISGGVGVGASVDVSVIRNTVTSYIGAYAAVHAEKDSSAAQPLGNVSVIADSNKNAESIVIAASGGSTVGVGAAVAVISIGASLDSDTQDSLGDLASFVDGKISSDQVSGQLGDSEHTQGTEDEVTATTGGLNIAQYLNETSSDSLNKTQSYIGAYATVTADGSVSVTATDTSSVSVISGGLGIGSVGVGGAVGVATIKSTTEAFTGSHASLSAGSITISAISRTKDDEGLSVLGLGGSAGIVGIGAAVAYLDVANITNAYLGSYTTAAATGAITVSAQSDIDLDAEAIGAAIGGGAIGGSFARAANTTTTSAMLKDHVTVSGAGSLTISALATGVISAEAIAGAAGIYSGSGAVATARFDPYVYGYIGNDSNLTVTNGINITAQSLGDVDASAYGVSVAYSVSVGVSYTDASLKPTVSAYIGDRVTITHAGNIVIKAMHNYDASGNKVANDVTSSAFSAAGSLIGSGAGADANTTHQAIVNASIGTGSHIVNASGVTVKAYGNMDADAEADGGALGFAGVGCALADTTVTAAITASVSGTIDQSTSITILAVSSGIVTAEAVAGAGGIISGSGAAANARFTPAVSAYIGANADITTSGAIAITAQSLADVDATATGVSVGAGLSVGVSLADARLLPTVRAYIADHVTLRDASGITIKALHNYDTSGNKLGNNVTASAFSAAGSLIGSGAGADADTMHTATVSAYIGSDSHIYDGGSIAVSAYGNMDADAAADGGAGGIVGVGCSLADTIVTATISASVSGIIDQSTSITILAVSSGIVTAEATAGAGGIISGSGAAANVRFTPTVSAYIGAYADITTTGAITITAQSLADVDATGTGVSVAGGLSVGVSLADARLIPTVNAYIADHVTVRGASGITIKALHNYDTSGVKLSNNVTAHAYSAAGSLIGSGAGADADTTHTAIVNAYIGSASHIYDGGSIVVGAYGNMDTQTDGSGVAGGIAGVGSVLADATVTATISASVSGIIDQSTSVSIIALSSGAVSANATAGSGGILSGSGADAGATFAPTVLAYLGSDADVTTSGSLTITARNTGGVTARAYGVSAGGLAVGVSLADASMSANVSAYINAGATVDAGSDVIVRALHNTDTSGNSLSKTVLAHANASAGALIGASGALSDVLHTAVVQAYAGIGTDVTAGRDIILNAYGWLDGDADADGNSYGVVGLGAVDTDTSITGTIRAYMDSTTASPSNVIAIRNLTLLATGTATPTAASEQAAGGIVGAGGSDATANASLTVSVALGSSGGVYDAGNDITLLATAKGYTSAIANGSNYGGISVGASNASSAWTANVMASVGTQTALYADHDISIRAYTYSTGGTASVYAKAASSTGSLVGGVGSVAVVTAMNTVQTLIGVSAHIEADNDISISSESDVVTKSEASGSAYGAAASGTTTARNTLNNTTLTWVKLGSIVSAGNDLYMISSAISNAALCKAQGGVGGFIGDASTRAVTDVDNSTKVILGENVHTTAINTNETKAESSIYGYGWAKIDTGGAVTFNKTQSDVDIDNLTQVEVRSGSAITGITVNIYSRVNNLVANSYAYSKTFAADSTTNADSNVNVDSDAKIIITATAIYGSSVIYISALHQGLDTSSTAYAEISVGLTGVVYSTAANAFNAYSFVDVQSGSSLYSDDITIEAISPHNTQDYYGKDATALARTVVNYVEQVIEYFITVVETVVEKVVEWLPWPFDELVKWVTKTITTLVKQTMTIIVEEILHSDVEKSTPGTCLSANAVNLDADVYLGNAGGVSLVINPDYTTTTQGSISGSVSGSDFIVDDFCQ